LVTAGQLAMIRRLAVERATPLEPAPASTATEIEFGGQQYRLADKPGLHYEMDLYDEAGLLKAVREAKRHADLVVFTIHAHESATGLDDDTPAPPDFLVKLFHEAVDAGADEILGGGPHSLRGIEIYKGRPVFYGMGGLLHPRRNQGAEGGRLSRVSGCERPRAAAEAARAFGSTGREPRELVRWLGRDHGIRGRADKSRPNPSSGYGQYV
jgi:hypothetical protein